MCVFSRTDPRRVNVRSVFATQLRDIAEDLGEPLSEIELQYLAKEFDTDERYAVDVSEMI